MVNVLTSRVLVNVCKCTKYQVFMDYGIHGTSNMIRIMDKMFVDFFMLVVE